MKTDLTVFYPCFNQPDKLIKSLATLQRQTYSNFCVILMDDFSTADYSFVMDIFSDLSITRIVNSHNLGAVPNMINCIRYPVDTAYKIIFHEDDLMHPQWLGLAVKAIKQNKGNVSWAACNMSFFTNFDNASFKQHPENPEVLINDIHELALLIVKGRTLSFASVVYDTVFCSQVSLLLDEFSVLGDRHLLLEMAKRYGFVYFNFDFVAAFDHTGKDSRWKNLQPIHIINFYLYLSTFFSKNELRHKEIVSGFTYDIVEKVKLLDGNTFIFTLKLYYNLHKVNLFSLKYYILSFSYVRTLVNFFKF